MTTSIKTINSLINNDCKKFIESSDKNFFNQIKKAAETIYNQHNQTPIILISGPSGSGKTTSATILKNILNDMGLNSHTISLDNYFSPLSEEELKLLSEGKMDLESPDRIDNDLLNQQIEKIINGEKVEIPTYDFKKSQRFYNGNFIQRKENEIVIFEGIHALNDNVITIDDSKTFKIYVSVRTRVESGGILMHPSKIRLLRRLIRDNIHRGRSADDTLQLFASVERGEHKYIMPYKKRSCFDIDTFIPYEISVYKHFLENNSMIIRHKTVTDDLLEILDKIKSIYTELISKDSLIYEFVGE